MAGRAYRPDAGEGSAPGNTALLQPDLTILFELDPGVAAQRLAGARAPDRFECQPADFFSAVTQGYAARQAADPQRFAVVQGDQPREEVWLSVLGQVEARGLLSDTPQPPGSSGG